MKRSATLWLAAGLAVSSCATPPPPAPSPAPVAVALIPPPPPPAAPPRVAVALVPPPRPLIEPWRARDCAMISAEIARQRGIAAMSGVMTTALVETAVRLNVSNVIDGLVTRGRIEGCW